MPKNKVNFTYKVDPDLLKQIKIHCIKKEITVATFITELATQYFQNQKLKL